MTYTQVKEAINDVGRSELENLIERFGEELVSKYQDDIGGLSDMEEAYQGEYKNDADFVEQLLTDCGDIPELPSYVYIDWERTANDVMMDYFEIDGHYFRSM